MGSLAVVHCGESFTLAAGHPLRASPCVACREPVGGAPVTVIGVAPLAGEVCVCGVIGGDLFLAHADHLPMEAAGLQRALHRALQCQRDHR
jgi:hypothetical protein